MPIREAIKTHITKLQRLPERNKKIVLWTIVAILAIVMGFFWIKSAMNKLSQIGNEIGQIEFPQIETAE